MYQSRGSCGGFEITVTGLNKNNTHTHMKATHQRAAIATSERLLLLTPKIRTIKT